MEIVDRWVADDVPLMPVGRRWLNIVNRWVANDVPLHSVSVLDAMFLL